MDSGTAYGRPTPSYEELMTMGSTSAHDAFSRRTLLGAGVASVVLAAGRRWPSSRRPHHRRRGRRGPPYGSTWTRPSWMPPTIRSSTRRISRRSSSARRPTARPCVPDWVRRDASPTDQLLSKRWMSTRPRVRTPQSTSSSMAERGAGVLPRILPSPPSCSCTAALILWFLTSSTWSKPMAASRRWRSRCSERWRGSTGTVLRMIRRC